MPETRAQRILRVLAEHPEGLSTPAIARETGERVQPRQQALTRCGSVLRRLNSAGLVARCGTTVEPGTYNNLPSACWLITAAGLDRIGHTTGGAAVTEDAGSPEPQAETVDAAMVADLDTRRQRARAQADAARAQVVHQEHQAGALAYAREWLASRVGHPWGDVRAEAEAELERTKADLAKAEEALRQAQQWRRDVIGAERYLRRLLDGEEGTDAEAGPASA